MRNIPQQLNNSFLADWNACQRRAQISELWGCKADTNIHLIAGGAFAAGLEAARRAYFENDESPDEATIKGIIALWQEFGMEDVPENAHHKSPLNMAKALVYTLRYAWPLSSNLYRPLGFEFSFAIPMPANHPITGQSMLHPNGEPFIYVGRADMMLADLQNRIFIEDDKTCSELGDSWHKQWEKASQFSGYIWAAQQSGYNVSGVIVRGVALYKSGSLASREYITYRTPQEIEMWLIETCDRIIDLLKYSETNRARFRLDKDCGSSFGGCPFLNICTETNANLAAHFSSYKRTQWDSVSRIRVPILEEIE